MCMLQVTIRIFTKMHGSRTRFFGRIDFFLPIGVLGCLVRTVYSTSAEACRLFLACCFLRGSNRARRPGHQHRAHCSYPNGCYAGP